MMQIEVEDILKRISKNEVGQLQDINRVEARRAQLAELKQRLIEGQSIIPLRSFLRLTKTENMFSESFLFRDLALERNVRDYLSSKASYSDLITRYNAYDPSVQWTEWPNHYAVRTLAGNGPVASGKNIFSFFPEALRLLPKNEQDVFGLEFIDVWENIFRGSIFPCVRKVFDFSSQLEIFSQLEVNLSRTIFLAAVFHEMGHRCGPWKVSPHADQRLKINSYHWGVMGEVATDSLLSVLLEEFPEICLFVTLQRLFWFGRRGVAENPISGMTNMDNDSWLGSYLWVKLKESGSLVRGRDNRWSLNSEKLANTYRGITEEIDQLASTVSVSEFDQDQQIEEWMKSKLNWNSQFGYMMPLEFREMLERCHEIPEQPHFATPFSLVTLKDYFRDDSRFSNAANFISFDCTI
jgi:hypothetical protein